MLILIKETTASCSFFALLFNAINDTIKQRIQLTKKISKSTNNKLVRPISAIWSNKFKFAILTHDLSFESVFIYIHTDKLHVYFCERWTPSRLHSLKTVASNATMIRISTTEFRLFCVQNSLHCLQLFNLNLHINPDMENLGSGSLTNIVVSIDQSQCTF